LKTSRGILDEVSRCQAHLKGGRPTETTTKTAGIGLAYPLYRLMHWHCLGHAELSMPSKRNRRWTPVPMFTALW